MKTLFARIKMMGQRSWWDRSKVVIATLLLIIIGLVVYSSRDTIRPYWDRMAAWCNTPAPTSQPLPIGDANFTVGKTENTSKAGSTTNPNANELATTDSSKELEEVKRKAITSADEKIAKAFAAAEQECGMPAKISQPPAQPPVIDSPKPTTLPVTDVPKYTTEGLEKFVVKPKGEPGYLYLFYKGVSQPTEMSTLGKICARVIDPPKEKIKPAVTIRGLRTQDLEVIVDPGVATSKVSTWYSDGRPEFQSDTTMKPTQPGTDWSQQTYCVFAIQYDNGGWYGPMEGYVIISPVPIPEYTREKTTPSTSKPVSQANPAPTAPVQDQQPTPQPEVHADANTAATQPSSSTSPIGPLVPAEKLGMKEEVIDSDNGPWFIYLLSADKTPTQNWGMTKPGTKIRHFFQDGKEWFYFTNPAGENKSFFLENGNLCEIVRVDPSIYYPSKGMKVPADWITKEQPVSDPNCKPKGFVIKPAR